MDGSAGEFQMGGDVKPLDPSMVGSVVRYGIAAEYLVHEATGGALVYSQLYPFEGLRNYTSGIIHHVRLQGDDSFIDPPHHNSVYIAKIAFFLHQSANVTAEIHIVTCV